ncbi:MAG: ankyrin repeat domain-containing protein, partial [Thermoguttaceae bacterium]|nr:ankyrin repeat domain-containing protein [Thermoguttaceae bacterium]
VQWLVEQGEDVNDKNAFQQTVLHLAVQSGNLEIAQWLVQHSADVFAKDDDEETVFQYAARSGNPALVQWLASYNAQTDTSSYSSVKHRIHRCGKRFTHARLGRIHSCKVFRRMHRVGVCCRRWR